MKMANAKNIELYKDCTDFERRNPECVSKKPKWRWWVGRHLEEEEKKQLRGYS